MATDSERLADLERAVAGLIKALAGTKAVPLTPSIEKLSPASAVDLLDWLERIYLHYPGTELAPCWAWHPDVIEELNVLRLAHAVVYATGDILLVQDWHDRRRPGVTRRAYVSLDGCDVNKHMPPLGPTVPLSGSLEYIAAAKAEGKPTPRPTAAQVEEARRITRDRR
jgi:hypothetical protein